MANVLEHRFVSHYLFSVVSKNSFQEARKKANKKLKRKLGRYRGLKLEKLGIFENN